MNGRTEKLTFKEKLGYGVATAGDGAVYNFVGIYFLFFLTTVAGVDPGKAGTISSLALFASAFFTIFIGYFSDNSRCKTGRRRPYIAAGLPFLLIAFVAMFTNIGLSDNGKVWYYAIFAVVFWLAYSMFYVPYTALGAEITSDYDDRTRIRTYTVTCNSVGNYFGMVFPLLIVGIFVGLGKSNSSAWTYTAVISGVFAVLTIGFMLRQTKGKELVIPPEKRAERKNIFSDYFEVVRVKPCKFLILSIICSIIGYTIFNGSVAYFITYNLGLPESYTSTIFLVLCVAVIIFAPLINKLAIKRGKRDAYIIALVLSSILMILFRVIGIHSQLMLLVLAAVYTIGGAGYWQLMSAIIYDLTEIVELKYKKRSEGTLSSLQSVFQQIGTSLGMLITGWILDLSGFDGNAAVQSQSALSGIGLLLTVLPAVGFLLGAAMMYLFPVTKARYELVQKALKDRDEKGEYSKEGLERII
ncbi:MFS transporter [Anaerovorax odorimutans]|uniref:MFS transporter n=1 Tax=Anaerovorax odorimutans TaxID=109327 RepID=A0ABT1RNY5_9FIRM|nr:MFS transporter [Anaerovorax odorimutans]MCQ4636904.1 MFS transporter [Anaerovorax odorimutans]